MLNGMRGEAPLGDETLVFDVDALIRAEDETGLDTQELLAKFAGGLSLRLVRTMVWAGLLRHKPNATADDASALITAVGIEATAQALGTALEAAFPSAEGKAKPTLTRKAKGGAGNRC